MRYAAFMLMFIAAVTITGCFNSDIEDDVSETQGRVDKLERDLSQSASRTSKRIEELSSGLDGVSSRIRKIEESSAGSIGDDIKSLKKSVRTIEKILEEVSEGEITFAGGAVSPDEGDEELRNDVDDLKEDLESLTAQVERLREERTAALEPRRTRDSRYWENMGDPKKLATGLDEFVARYGPKLDESGTRSEFEADIEAFKAEAAQDFTTDELMERYRSLIMAQMAEVEDDRATGWYENQLKAIEQTPEKDRRSRLIKYMRYHNMRELSKIARKYKIPATEFSKYGLQIMRGAPNPRSRGGDRY